jgi:ABC-2 type transport system permease protein
MAKPLMAKPPMAGPRMAPGLLAQKKVTIMRNTLALAKRILQQFKNDKRTVALFIIAPIVALWLFSAILEGAAYQPRLATVDVPDEVFAALADQDASVITATSGEAAQLLASQEVDAVITIKDQRLQVLVEGANSNHTAATLNVARLAAQELISQQREEVMTEMRELLGAQAALSALSSPAAQAAQAADPAAAQSALSAPAADPAAAHAAQLAPSVESIEEQLTVTDVEVSYLHGEESWSTFDFIGPVFIGIFIFVFVFITSGMSLVAERTGGTLERLFTTPIKSWQIVGGYMLGYGLASLIQAAIVLWASISLIGFPNEGNILLVFLVVFSLTFVSLSLGLLVSALARNAFQVIQLMILFVVPQILLSGIFDLSQAPGWLQAVAAVFPLGYGAEALRNIMLRGADLGGIATNLAVLWAFIAAFFVAASLSYQQRRAH